MELAVIMNNKAPGTTLLGELVVAANSGQTLEQIAGTLAARAEFTAEYPLHQTPAEFGAEWIANILPEADAALQAECVKIVEAHVNGGGTVPALVVSVQAFMSDTANATGTLKTHIDNFSNKVAVATYHTITKEAAAEWAIPSTVSSDSSTVATAKGSVDVATAPPPAPADVAKTIAFTSSTDVGSAFQAGGGDDTFNGVLVGASAVGTTIQPGDSIKGGAGTDTLAVSVSGAISATDTTDYTLQAVSTEGIEKVLYSNFNTDTNDHHVLDASLMTGVATLGLSASSAEGDLSVTGLKNLVDAEMRNGNADLTLTYNAAASAGTTTVQNLTVSAVSAGSFSASGSETIAVTGELAKSTLTDISGSTLNKITFSGDVGLTVTNALTEKTIDASGSTAGVTLELGANAAHVVTGSSGNDTFNSRATISSADTVTGGDGDDVLKVQVGGTLNKGTATAKGELYNVSGFETLDVDATNDAAIVNAKDVGSPTIKLAANTKTITISSTGDGSDADVWTTTINGTDYVAAAVAGAGNQAADEAEAALAIATVLNASSKFTASASTDTVTVTADSGEVLDITAVNDSVATDDGTGAVSDYFDVSVTNIGTETIDLFSGDHVTLALADASGSTDVLNLNIKTLTADRAISEQFGDITASNIETINLDVTGMKDGNTKTIDLIAANLASTLNITGDSDTIITAVTGSTKLANINAGTFTGDLSIPEVPAALASTITTGTGNDTLVMAGRLGATDTIDMGGNSLVAGSALTGSDKLTLTGNQGTVVADAALNIANVEKYEQTIGAAASTYIDGTNLTNIGSLAFANDTNGGTVKLTNLPAGQKIGLGVGTTELGKTATVTLNVALADSTGTEDSFSLDYTDSALEANSVTLVSSGIETMSVSAGKAGSGVTSTLVNTSNAVSTINVSGGLLAGTGLLALGTLNKATTVVNAAAALTKISVDTATTSAATVTAIGGYLQNITTGTGSDTITLTSNTGTNAHTINGVSGSGDTLNLTANNAATDFTNVSNIDTINITVAGAVAAGVNNGTKDNGLNTASVVNILGGDSLSSFTLVTGGLDDDALGTNMKFDASTFGGKIDIAVLGDAFDAELSILGGASATDKVTVAASTATDNKIALMSGVETLVLNSTDTDTDLDFDLTNVTGLKTVDTVFAGGTADQIEIKKLPASVTKVKTTSVTTLDDLTIGLASSTGSTDALTVEITAQGTGHVLDLNAAGIETLNLTQKDADGGGVNLAGVTATTGSTTTVNISGTGPIPLKSLSTSIKTIASSGTGALTVAVADRPATALTITGGLGNDVLSMEHAGDVLDGGLGTDSLDIDIAGILGGIQIDLGAADQITTVDGVSNAGVQTGFESIDVSGYTGFGAIIDGRNSTTIIDTVTGTGSSDRITLKKGNDVLTATDGNDVIDLGAGNDEISITAARIAALSGNTQTISGGTGTNKFTVVGAATIQDADFARVTNMQSITLADATNSVTLSTNAVATGIVTVTGGTGADTVVGSSLAETIVSGTGADIIKAGGGADVITVAGTDDDIQQVAIGDSGIGTYVAGMSGTSVSTVGMDLITGVAAGTKFTLPLYNIASNDTAADGKLDLNGEANSTDLTTTVVANSILLVDGVYDAAAQTFTEGGGQTDGLLVYDANRALGITALEAVVLIGTNLDIATNAGTGIHTIAADS
jgi:hypothetical protein